MTTPPETHPKPPKQSDGQPGRATGISATGAAAAARGIPGSWIMGGALVVALTMIILLLGMIAGSGLTTFWPKPIERVELVDGPAFLGIRIRSEVGPSGDRTLYRVGNRDLGQTPFRWVATDQIASTSTPADAVLLEREAWGVWIGTLEDVVDTTPGRRVSQTTGDESAVDALKRLHPQARRALAQADDIRKGEIGRVNRQIEANRLALQQARLDAQRTREKLFPRWLWIASLIGAPLSLLAGAWLAFGGGGARSFETRSWRPVMAGVCVVSALVAGIGAWVEAPRAGGTQRLAEREARAPQVEAELFERIDALNARIKEIEQDQAGLAVMSRDLATGSLAPASASERNKLLPVASIVRVVPSNTLSFADKVGVYLDRWREFLTQDPRAANTEGGIFPVIFGTVLLTLLLTISVLPLGVIAALYMREYAKQGLLVSILRIAINNLAGVPSIVYGVFGLGFFCYTVGKYIDVGPREPSSAGSWWGVVVVGAVIAASAMATGLLATPEPGKPAGRGTRVFKALSVGGWLAAGAMAVWLIASTPYFNGFFEARTADGSPTFGGRGLLWASLTLALLTLPVVIVATEEAIAAVPASMREGSYGCGASKWQTIRNIVLPGAMPGIMTGAILAMARGAGEVAPLMIVGAVKLAPQLPFEGRFPFVFADRSFMHLGFHIFDLGFQSPDSEAARGMVWTTTLVLITLVVLLNIAAIILRARLRARSGSGQF